MKELHPSSVNTVRIRDFTTFDAKCDNICIIRNLLCNLLRLPGKRRQDFGLRWPVRQALLADLPALEAAECAKPLTIFFESIDEETFAHPADADKLYR